MADGILTPLKVGSADIRLNAVATSETAAALL